MRTSPPPREPATTEVWTRRFLIVLTTLGSIAIIALCLWLLSQITDAIIVFLMSALVAYLIYPLVRILRRFIPGVLAAFIIYIAIFGVILAFFYFVCLTAIGQFVVLVTSIQAQLPQLLTFVQPLIRHLQALGVTSAQINNVGQQAINYMLDLLKDLQPFLLGFFGLLLNAILVTTLSVYFLFDGPRLNSWLRTRTPAKYRNTFHVFLQTADKNLGGFIRGQLFLGVVVSTIMGVCLLIINVPYAMLLALIIFIFEFIPQIGAYISGTIVVLVALVTRGWEIGLFVALLSSFVQAILDGQILAPRIIGHSVGLNPLISIFALLVGAQLFGLIGAFLAAPVAGIIQAFVISYYAAWKERHPEQFPEQAIENAQTEPPASLQGPTETTPPPLKPEATPHDT
jgi:predicted PurR-regulated permease PerM